MEDPERFVADPDSTFHADDAYPDPDPKIFLTRERNKFVFQIFNFFLHNLTKHVMCNFLRNNAGRVARGER